MEILIIAFISFILGIASIVAWETAKDTLAQHDAETALRKALEKNQRKEI